MAEQTIFEWRVHWSAATTIGFHGASDWETWEGDEETEAAVQEALEATNGPSGGASIGEETFWEASGAEWSIEVREQGASS